MKYIKLLIVACCILASVSKHAQGQVNGNPTTSDKFVMKNDQGNTIMLAPPATGVTNYTLTFPPTVSGTGSLVYTGNPTGSLTWLPPGTNGQVLTISGGVPTWSAAAATGVTSVGLAMPSIFTVTNSPVTSSGILTASLNAQNANLVFAGPSTGAPAVPTFRALTPSDFPTLPYVSSVGLQMPAVLYSSVTNSPITTSGTLIPQLATQNAKKVFAGPVSGVDATPTFRLLQTTDLPIDPASYILNGTSLQSPANFNISGNGTMSGQLQLKGTSTGLTTFQAGAQGASNINYTLPISAPSVNGQVLSSTTAGTMSWATVGTGSVTSVGLAMPSIFTVTNSPVTTSGTLTASLNTQNANLFFAGPSSGAAAVPTFRALAPVDFPTLPYVSSVGLSMPSIFTVTNSPVTSTGTLTASLATQASNLVFAGPASGAAATPTFRLLQPGDVSGAAWSLNGNSITSAWNGATGSFLGTTNTQPLVIATTNTTTAQPIEFFTNNTEQARLDASGNFGLGAVPNVKADINGGIAYRPSASTISASGSVTVGNRSYVRLTHDLSPGTYTMSLSNGLQDGQIVIIQVESVDNSKIIKLGVGGTLAISGDFAPNTSHSTISLIWDNANTKWVETARSLN